LVVLDVANALLDTLLLFTAADAGHPKREKEFASFLLLILAAALIALSSLLLLSLLTTETTGGTDTPSFRVRAGLAGGHFFSPTAGTPGDASSFLPGELPSTNGVDFGESAPAAGGAATITPSFLLSVTIIVGGGAMVVTDDDDTLGCCCCGKLPPPPPKRNPADDFPPGSDNTREVDRVTKLF